MKKIIVFLVILVLLLGTAVATILLTQKKEETSAASSPATSTSAPVQPVKVEAAEITSGSLLDSVSDKISTGLLLEPENLEPLYKRLTDYFNQLRQLKVWDKLGAEEAAKSKFDVDKFLAAENMPWKDLKTGQLLLSSETYSPIDNFTLQPMLVQADFESGDVPTQFKEWVDALIQSGQANVESSTFSLSTTPNGDGTYDLVAAGAVPNVGIVNIPARIAIDTNSIAATVGAKDKAAFQSDGKMVDTAEFQKVIGGLAPRSVVTGFNIGTTFGDIMVKNLEALKPIITGMADTANAATIASQFDNIAEGQKDIGTAVGSFNALDGFAAKSCAEIRENSSASRYWDELVRAKGSVDAGVMSKLISSGTVLAINVSSGVVVGTGNQALEQMETHCANDPSQDAFCGEQLDKLKSGWNKAKKIFGSGQVALVGNRGNVGFEPELGLYLRNTELPAEAVIADFTDILKETAGAQLSVTADPSDPSRKILSDGKTLNAILAPIDGNSVLLASSPVAFNALKASLGGSTDYLGSQHPGSRGVANKLAGYPISVYFSTKPLSALARMFLPMMLMGQQGAAGGAPPVTPEELDEALKLVELSFLGGADYFLTESGAYCGNGEMRTLG